MSNSVAPQHRESQWGREIATTTKKKKIKQNKQTKKL
jgi:hypothetical protein